MVKRGRLMALSVLFIILFANVAYASVIRGNASENIAASYSPGEKLRGWINISLSNEPGNSMLTSNFHGGIRIKDFLDNNSAYYTCIPSDCSSDYETSNGEEVKSYSLSDSEKISAFKLEGNVRGLDRLEFDIEASNSQSCINPLSIDFLDNGNDWKAHKFTDDYSCIYENGMGCFNPSEILEEVHIASTPRCEKIKLVESGKFQLGAWVKGTGTGLMMELYDLDNQKTAGCNLPAPSVSGGEISCNINYNNSETKYYYACIKASSGNLFTKSESVNSCGFFAAPGQQTEYHDYWIFAMGARFGNIGKFRMSRILGTELKSLSLDYLTARYRSPLNCTNGCIVPVKFNANGDVGIIISNLTLVYLTGNDIITSRRIYDANPGNTRINSGFASLDLEKSGIVINGSYGGMELKIYLNGNEIVSKSINISRAAVINRVVPSIVPAAALTRFFVNVSGGNISRYFWDFGDGESEETEENSVSHAYSSVGSYTLEIRARDNSGNEVSRRFTIISGNPQEVVNSTLKEYRIRLNNLGNLENNWYKKILEDEIGIDELDEKLTEAEKKYEIGTEEKYIEAMTLLNSMKIPKEVRKGEEINFPMLIDSGDIDLEKLAEMGAGEYEDETGIKNAIAGWNSGKVSVVYFPVEGYYDNSAETIIGVYKLGVSGEEESFENYAVINRKAKVNGENVKELGNYTGIKFSELKAREIDFAVPHESNPLDIIAYFSPDFDNLDISTGGICNYNSACEKENGENWKNCRSDCKPYGLAILLIFLVIFAAFITYLFLQNWYKKRYESYLFKNRNDLFNIVNFINNSMLNKISREDIEKRLKQSGWHSEQIKYAWKKVRGKKTGMPLEFSLKFGKDKQEKK